METLKTVWEILHELNTWSVAFRVVLSVLLGGFIGLERGYHGRAAGLRTHILVCLGATIATLVGLYSVTVLGFNSDPLCVGAQVVSGIGFLGVGTILVRNRTQVTGLTTAAGLWATACIGLSVGIGFYAVALFSFAAVMITITVFVHLEKPSKSKAFYVCYVELMDVEKVKELCDELEPFASKIDVVPAKSGIPSHIGLEFQTDTLPKYEMVLDKTKENDHLVIALPIQF